MEGSRKPVFGHMLDCMRWGILLAVIAAISASCRTVETGAGSGAGKPACYVVYDAGSSATRLFVYQRSAAGWLVHPGPRTSALADPVRGNRGKTMADAEATVNALIGSLDDIRGDGPPDGNGQPRWTAFDWPRQCNIKAADVYGSAGMRIAEQQDHVASGRMWKMVREKLAKTLDVPVIARTLSEFEEGLFAWLALSESLPDAGFGVAEMGGASLQVTFPCSDCDGAKGVWVKGRAVEIYSRSLLGWGQDEAWKDFGQVAACERGAGIADPAWRPEDCAAVMEGFTGAVSDLAGYVKTAAGLHWYVSDAFRYMQSSDIENYCRKGLDSGFQAESSCFRAVYLQNVLKRLGIPLDADKSDANWTLGAVVCAATRCLESRQAH